MDSQIEAGVALFIIFVLVLVFLLWITRPKNERIENLSIKKAIIPPTLKTIDYLLKAIIFAPIFKLLMSPTNPKEVTLSVIFIIVFGVALWFCTWLSQKINLNLKDH